MPVQILRSRCVAISFDNQDLVPSNPGTLLTIICSSNFQHPGDFAYRRTIVAGGVPLFTVLILGDKQQVSVSENSNQFHGRPFVK